ncbi:MAG: hypothetical protein AAF310_04620, partial [Myxococcota bacterium]
AFDVTNAGQIGRIAAQVTAAEEALTTARQVITASYDALNGARQRTVNGGGAFDVADAGQIGRIAAQVTAAEDLATRTVAAEEALTTARQVITASYRALEDARQRTVNGGGAFDVTNAGQIGRIAAQVTAAEALVGTCVAQIDDLHAHMGDYQIEVGAAVGRYNTAGDAEKINTFVNIVNKAKGDMKNDADTKAAAETARDDAVNTLNDVYGHLEDPIKRTVSGQNDDGNLNDFDPANANHRTNLATAVEKMQAAITTAQAQFRALQGAVALNDNFTVVNGDDAGAVSQNIENQVETMTNQIARITGHFTAIKDHLHGTRYTINDDDWAAGNAFNPVNILDLTTLVGKIQQAKDANALD